MALSEHRKHAYNGCKDSPPSAASDKWKLACEGLDMVPSKKNWEWHPAVRGTGQAENKGQQSKAGSGQVRMSSSDTARLSHHQWVEEN